MPSKRRIVSIWRRYNVTTSSPAQDYERWLEELAPHEPTARYRHNDTGEDNADAHLKRQVMGREVVGCWNRWPGFLWPM